MTPTEPGRGLVICLGEAMVSLRGAAPLLTGAALEIHVAGAEANVAIGLARLGHRTSWVSRLGNDEPGRLVARELRAEGVDLDHVVHDPNHPTGMMLALRRSAEVTSVDYRRTGSAASHLSPADVVFLEGERPQVLVVSGITAAISASAAECVVAAVHTAHRCGATVILDVNHRERLWSRARAATVLRALLDEVDVLVAGEDEIDIVAGSAHDGEVTRVDELLTRVDTVLLKRGARGATSWHKEGEEIVQLNREAMPVQAVDPVGAGDAFTAGWISGLLDGLDGVGRLERAIQLGGCAVTSRGDWEGLPHRDELELLARAEAGTTAR